MSEQTIQTIIAIVLLLHGLAHGKAFFSLLADAFRTGKGNTLPVRTWIFPSLSIRVVSLAASVFYLIATIGFLATAWLVWSSGLTGETWRQIAIGAAIISTLGSLIFSGIWPGAPTERMSNLDTVISLALNAIILVALAWLNWPAQGL
jgi:hypothetical protein